MLLMPQYYPHLNFTYKQGHHSGIGNIEEWISTTTINQRWGMVTFLHLNVEAWVPTIRKHWDMGITEVYVQGTI